jgi:predicted methyltransferase
MTVDMPDMPAGTANAAIPALNLHDAFKFRGEAGGKAFVQDNYNVLKPGGVAAIIDHEGTAGMNNSDLHRIPAADTKRLLESVGFIVVKESQVLNNPDMIIPLQCVTKHWHAIPIAS